MADNKTQIVITAKDETGAAIASAKRGLDSLGQAGASLRSSFGFLASAGGLAGLIGGISIAGTVKTAVDELDKLNDSVERLGISAEDLSALNFAGKLNAVDADEMAEALKKLSVKMQEAASGSKEATALFADLGVKVTDASGRLKSADAVFAEIADAFAGLEDGAGKTALAVDTFGKAGAKLVPLLNNGADGLAKMRKEGEALGAVIDGKLAKQAADFNDNLDRLSVVSAAAGRSIAAELLPWLNKLSEEFLAGIQSADGFLGALNAFGTLNPFKSTSENLATVRADLEKIEADRKEYGYVDEARLKRKTAQLEYLKKLQIEEAVAGSKGDYGNEGRGVPTTEAKKAVVRTPIGEDKPRKTGGARAQADEAARLLESLNEQIALKNTDAQTTDKMTEAEKQAVKVRYQLEAGTLKATDAQRAAINTALDNLVALDKTLQAQKEYQSALDRQEQSNVKANQALLEQIASVEKANETYGLTASAINAMTVARLEDAAATARQRGASEDQIAVLEEEAEKYRKLGQALDGNDLQRLLSATETAKNAKAAADKATLDRALSSGKIDPKQYNEAIAAMENATDQMSEFAIQAARNMQDAFAEFLFDPFADGANNMIKNFGTATQKMIAQQAALQAMNWAFGDKFSKTGELGGIAKPALDWLSDLFKFEGGGIMTSAGPLPLKKYASGGIANSPQLAMFGEGRTPEAYVPLPDGRRIPVAMQGGQGGTVVQNLHFYGAAEPAQVKRAAAAGYRRASGAMATAGRYS